VVLSGCSGGAGWWGLSRSLGLLVVGLVGDVLPILENSTACTIVNANYLVQVLSGVWLGFLWIDLDVS
jgi:hypothetical protein